ncbi:ABC transporter ATP-binding protein [Allostreptomyces psammosilenae]|uniref:ATP-binding cassette subfamily B protein n=1 Tax=Allostreptomyces psammosilenae TaxID=1892865 RepID=A0A853A779_9ACTN|nr:ABC transporter ATP-binding protein [Allostreptomyces psammosilenae]NYI06521.1 ATP-binding cassette subfamily B protein [Allostreptomyces psammosilenae]
MATEPASPTSPAPSSLRTLLRLRPYTRPAHAVLLVSITLTLIASMCALAMPLVLRSIIDGPVSSGDLDALWPPVLLVLGLGVAEVVLFWLRRHIVARPLADVEARMRVGLYRHLQRLQVAFHDRWQSGQLLSRATYDLNLIRMFLSFGVVFLVVNAVTAVVGLVALIVMEWRLGVLATVTLLPMVVFSSIFEHRYQVATRLSQDQNGDLATVLEESVLGIRVLKAFGRHRTMERRFGELAARLRATELHKARLLGRLWAGIILLPEAAITLSLAYGIVLVADGSLTAGTLVAFLATLQLLRWPIDSLGWLLALGNDAASAAGRYFEVCDTEVVITDGDGARGGTAGDGAGDGRRAGSAGRAAGSAGRTGSAGEPTGRLVFHDVRFRFADAPPDTPDLLRGVDLEVAPGETVALVGLTGSGKTALTALVPRLYEVTGGSVTLDGVDVRDLPLERLRTLVATAFEEPILFSASVRDNVLLGHPEGTDEDVRRALEIAQADFVDALPQGLDTRIGEQGLSLSGGQRQRLALARAVAARPRFLVLDDPLSALDVHTEAAVEQALRRVLATTTALIVAHRPSTVMLADRVAVLREGRVTETGTHEELLASSPFYRYLLSADEKDHAALDAAGRDGHPDGNPDERPNRPNQNGNGNRNRNRSEDEMEASR